MGRERSVRTCCHCLIYHSCGAICLDAKRNLTSVLLHIVYFPSEFLHSGVVLLCFTPDSARIHTSFAYELERFTPDLERSRSGPEQSGAAWRQ
jgi:hypothetical protein